MNRNPVLLFEYIKQLKAPSHTTNHGFKIGNKIHFCVHFH